MLITDLGNQHIILGKPWMNKHKVLLDMADDRIVFVPGRCDHTGAPTPKPPKLPTSSLGVEVTSTASKSAKPTKVAVAKPKPKKALDISQIGAASFHLLA